MDNIIIRRLKSEDTDGVFELFDIVVKDTFKRNGFENLRDMIDEIIEEKKKYVNDDIETKGENRFFLIAISKNKIVGTIEYGKSSKTINQCVREELKDIYEIGTVFVHPEYQQKGIGTSMLKEILKEFKKKNRIYFCIESGYKIAQKVWTKKFGEPQYCVKEFWAKNVSNMIWKLKVSDILN